MEIEMDGGILSRMMSMDGGAKKFVVDCLLLLSPEEVKSCRLVCEQWNIFIEDEVWKNSRGRRQLREKLLQR